MTSVDKSKWDLVIEKMLIGQCDADVCKALGITSDEFIHLQYTPEFDMALHLTREKILSSAVQSYFQDGGKVVHPPAPCVSV